MVCAGSESSLLLLTRKSDTSLSSPLGDGVHKHCVLVRLALTLKPFQTNPSLEYMCLLHFNDCEQVTKGRSFPEKAQTDCA